mgnify:FL=1
MAVIEQKENSLYWSHDSEKLLIQPWGKDSIRVRSTKNDDFTSGQNWALLDPEKTDSKVTIDGQTGSVTNGDITAEINEYGILKFVKGNGKVLVEERWQNQPFSSLGIKGRELKPNIGGEYKATLRLYAHDDEKIFGMGQRQEKQLDMKGCVLELAHRNTQASVPFAVSNRGYGFLWNNPGVGRVTFGNNETEWEAVDTDQIDFWITAADSINDIEKNYANATGHVPMMPRYASGFWQCKLRYKTQEELLKVAHEYVDRGLPISVIVIDFFHWPKQGEWKLDPKFWPNPKAMVKELESLGIKLMVSIWPTVDVNSENYDEMEDKGYLVRGERMFKDAFHFMGNEAFFDATNKGSREFVWSKAKKNYYDNGVRLFWLDEAEPEYAYDYDFDHYRYTLGRGTKVTNIYPFEYARTFYEGQKKAGQKDVINLIRCVWAGSQRYGTLLWSGDVRSDFDSLQRQVVAGMNAGLSGIPWWTTDIGGFTHGNNESPDFHELLVRWFQFGVFCPVTRLHGFREPIEQSVEGADRMFNQPFGSGSYNEIYKYPKSIYEILRRLLFMREALRDYVMDQMKLAHEDGTPVMRPLFYDFSNDDDAWNIADEYMFGPDILVAPIIKAKQSKRDVYLPAGTQWIDVRDGKTYEGGETVTVDAPLSSMPVFTRADKPVQALLDFEKNN